MSEDYVPLSEQYQKTVKELEQLESSSLRKDSSEFKELASELETKLTALKKRIQRLALFSNNEDLEEVLTKEIQYLNVDYYLASFYELSNSSLKERQTNLKLSKNLYLQFLHNLANYQILDKLQEQKVDSFKNSFNPTLAEIRPDDPTRRRDEKIARHKYEQELVHKLKLLNDLLTNLDNLDDEVVRLIYIDQLRLHSVKLFLSIESIIMELELLSNFASRPSKIEEIKDDRMERAAAPSLDNDYLYTDKLETLTTPLLSKTGKILRPFTILPDRNAVKQKVFGTGQVLPSMTVEEFLEQELENGGMVKAKDPNEDKELDEDNTLEVDLETYKQRQWDEFKEANAKGSGNTINRG